MFVAEGARVLVSDFSGEEADTAAELGASAVSFKADVTDESQIAAMFARAMEVYGRVDASIHVAGNPGGRWATRSRRRKIRCLHPGSTWAG